MTRSNSPLSSASLALALWRSLRSDLQRPFAALRSMPWWCSASKACSSSRFTTRLRALSRLSVRVTCLVAALVYTAASVTSDYEYGQGIRTRDAVHFYRSANLFPLARERRSAPGYVTIVRNDYAKADLIDQALRFDPNAADLWLGLLIARLKTGDEAKAVTAAYALRKLAPQVVTISEGRR